MPKEEIYQQTMLDFLHAGDTIFPGQLAFFSGIKARIDEKEVQPMYTQFLRERDYEKIADLYVATGVLPAEKTLRRYVRKLEERNEEKI